MVQECMATSLLRNARMEVDTSALDQEIENYKIQLRKLYHNKDTILSDMDSIDYEDKHYQRRKTDLENHLYKTYDKIDEAEKRESLSQLVDNVQIYEERKENGQWLKSIEFKLPIIEKEFALSLERLCAL